MSVFDKYEISVFGKGFSPNGEDFSTLKKLLKTRAHVYSYISRKKLYKHNISRRKRIKLLSEYEELLYSIYKWFKPLEEITEHNGRGIVCYTSIENDSKKIIQPNIVYTGSLDENGLYIVDVLFGTPIEAYSEICNDEKILERVKRSIDSQVFLITMTRETIYRARYITRLARAIWLEYVGYVKKLQGDLSNKGLIIIDTDYYNKALDYFNVDSDPSMVLWVNGKIKYITVGLRPPHIIRHYFFNLI